MLKLEVTYCDIKKSFEKEEYLLLSKVYINTTCKLKYRCRHGHEHSISWSGWRRGYRCPYCAGVAKKTIIDVKRSFENSGYLLLSDKYINSNTKLKCKCPNDHIYNTAWYNWHSGYRCAECAKTNRATKLRKSYNEVYNIFLKENNILLSKEYKNAHGKLNVECQKGHVYQISLHKFMYGRRCSVCATINKFGSGNPNWRGGASFEPYCHVWKDSDYLDDIKNRDGYACLNPGCNLKNSSNLTIHHIDYNKKNCTPTNLITVCRSCNSRANKDREWHTVWYQTILSKRYNYKY
jgi:hypothetical protein